MGLRHPVVHICLSEIHIYGDICFVHGYTHIAHIHVCTTGWRRLIGCFKLQVVCAKQPLIIGLFCGK